MSNIGMHFSNKQWEYPNSEDLYRLKLSNPACIKTCLFTHSGFDQTALHRDLRQRHPEALIVVRLFAAMGGGAWSPDMFAANFQPHIDRLQGITEWFEVHNEPNHRHDVEGFGDTPADYQRFAEWSQTTLALLQHNHPWARWVFPGQMVHPVQQIQFWDINRTAIEKFDAFGVHCYWQFDNATHRDWGQCYEVAHEMIPNKPIIITEFGDATVGRAPDEKIPIYDAWYRRAQDQDYIMGTSLFLIGGTDDWINQPGQPNYDVTRTMATSIGNIPRTGEPIPIPPDPPSPIPAEILNNQDVITGFKNVSLALGMGNWGLMDKAGLSLNELAADREGPYLGPNVAEMDNLNDEERALLNEEFAGKVFFNDLDLYAINQDIITAFKMVSIGLNMGNWGLMSKAGLSLNTLAEDRQACYQHTAPRLRDLTLTADEHYLLNLALADLIDLPTTPCHPPQTPPATPTNAPLTMTAFSAEAEAEPPVEAVRIPISAPAVAQPFSGDWLLHNRQLLRAPLDPARSLQLRAGDQAGSLEKRVSTAWNRYGMLLLAIADTLTSEPAYVVSIVANQSSKRGLGRNKRLLINFRPEIFFQLWGAKHNTNFDDHFAFNENLPQYRAQWRIGPNESWEPVHQNQESEWGTLTQARRLDETSALLATQMGLTQILGLQFALAGYQAVSEMFQAFSTSERYQLLALFDIIAGQYQQSAQLNALQQNDLATFATQHYGPAAGAQQLYFLQAGADIFRRLNPLQRI